MSQGYKIGDKVNFIDDSGCHIKGVIISKHESEREVILFVNLESGEVYRAHLIREY